MPCPLHPPARRRSVRSRLGEAFWERGLPVSSACQANALPEAYRMPDRGRLALTPDGGVLINTSRGVLGDHRAFTAELISGRLGAVLEVTEPELLGAESPYDLPNVFITPYNRIPGQ